MLNKGYKTSGTEGLKSSSAKGRTFNRGRKLFDAAKANMTDEASKIMERIAKFTENRRNIIGYKKISYNLAFRLIKPSWHRP